MNISINKNCIGCGRCVSVCPANLFFLNEETRKAGIAEPEKCIVCGHCVAACPADAISHEEFPEGKIHAFERSALPSADSVELLIRSRRSNRAFSKEKIERSELLRIAEAAHRAPTASNLQQVKIVVVSDPVILQQIIDTTMKHFEKLLRLLETPLLKPIIKAVMPDSYNRYAPSFRKMIRRHRNGQDPILRGATAAIFFYTPKDCRFGCEDANLAYQNASLMAESMGISQFYTGFVCNAEKSERKKKIAQLLGIDGTIRAGMGLGRATFEFSRYIDKKDMDIKWL